MSVEFVGLQVGSLLAYELSGVFKSLTCVKVGWP